MLPPKTKQLVSFQGRSKARLRNPHCHSSPILSPAQGAVASSTAPAPQMQPQLHSYTSELKLINLINGISAAFPHSEHSASHAPPRIASHGIALVRAQGLTLKLGLCRLLVGSPGAIDMLCTEQLLGNEFARKDRCGRKASSSAVLSFKARR